MCVEIFPVKRKKYILHYNEKCDLQIYKWTRETVLRFLPIMVLSVLNFQIMMAFRKRQKMFARLTNREQNHASRDDTLLYILGGIG